MLGNKQLAGQERALSHIPLVDFPQAQVLDPLDLLNKVER